MKERVCLHKGFFIGNDIVVFGSKENFIQFFNKNNLISPEKSGVCSITDLPYTVIE